MPILDFGLRIASPNSYPLTPNNSGAADLPKPLGCWIEGSCKCAFDFSRYLLLRQEAKRVVLGGRKRRKSSKTPIA